MNDQLTDAIADTVAKAVEAAIRIERGRIRTQVENLRDEVKALRDKWAQHALGQLQASSARGISFAKSLHCETETEAYQRVLDLIDIKKEVIASDAGGPSDPRE